MVTHMERCVAQRGDNNFTVDHLYKHKLKALTYNIKIIMIECILSAQYFNED